VKQTLVAEVVAFLAIGWPFITLLLSALLFWIDIPIGPYHLWAGLLLALGAARLLAGDWRPWLTATAWLAVATIAGGVALNWYYDFSGDGQWYHLPAVLALAEGWNPFLVPELAQWSAGFEKDLTNAVIYVQHYAKGVWIVAAAAYRATGLLEATKVFGLLYLLAVYLLAATFLTRMGLSRVWSHALALTAALNPVALYQLPSFFVDGQLASLCALLILLSLDYLHRSRLQTLLLLALCVVLLVNIKFTGLVYAAVIGSAFTVVALLRRRYVEGGRYVATGMASLLLASAVIGYQPYLTNLISKGNPFYPAVARDKAATEATEGQFELWAPAEFLGMSRTEKLLRSLFARSSAAKSMPEWKIPFTVSKSEMYIFFNTEPRYGGFGPFFGAILAATLFLYILAAGATKAGLWKAGAGIAALVMLSVMPNPEAWWARLAPQLWLVPVILIAALAAGASHWPRKVAAALTVLLLANSALVAALNWGRATEKNLAFREQMAELRAMSSSAPLRLSTDPRFRMVTEHRLSAGSVVYQLTEELPCPRPLRFSYPNQPALAQAAACPAPGT
jgi:hypothetical protein